MKHLIPNEKLQEKYIKEKLDILKAEAAKLKALMMSCPKQPADSIISSDMADIDVFMSVLVSTELSLSSLAESMVVFLEKQKNKIEEQLLNKLLLAKEAIEKIDKNSFQELQKICGEYKTVHADTIDDAVKIIDKIKIENLWSELQAVIKIVLSNLIEEKRTSLDKFSSLAGTVDISPSNQENNINSNKNESNFSSTYGNIIAKDKKEQPEKLVEIKKELLSYQEEQRQQVINIAILYKDILNLIFKELNFSDQWRLRAVSKFFKDSVNSYIKKHVLPNSLWLQFLKIATSCKSFKGDGLEINSSLIPLEGIDIFFENILVSSDENKLTYVSGNKIVKITNFNSEKINVSVEENFFNHTLISPKGEIFDLDFARHPIQAYDENLNSINYCLPKRSILGFASNNDLMAEEEDKLIIWDLKKGIQKNVITLPRPDVPFGSKKIVYLTEELVVIGYFGEDMDKGKWSDAYLFNLKTGEKKDINLKQIIDIGTLYDMNIFPNGAIVTHSENNLILWQWEKAAQSLKPISVFTYDDEEKRKAHNCKIQILPLQNPAIILSADPRVNTKYRDRSKSPKYFDFKTKRSKELPKCWDFLKVLPSGNIIAVDVKNQLYKLSSNIKKLSENYQKKPTSQDANITDLPLEMLYILFDKFSFSEHLKSRSISKFFKTSVDAYMQRTQFKIKKIVAPFILLENGLVFKIEKNQKIKLIKELRNILEIFNVEDDTESNINFIGINGFISHSYYKHNLILVDISEKIEQVIIRDEMAFLLINGDVFRQYLKLEDKKCKIDLGNSKIAKFVYEIDQLYCIAKDGVTIYEIDNRYKYSIEIKKIDLSAVLNGNKIASTNSKLNDFVTSFYETLAFVQEDGRYIKYYINANNVKEVFTLVLLGTEIKKFITHFNLNFILLKNGKFYLGDSSAEKFYHHLNVDDFYINDKEIFFINKNKELLFLDFNRINFLKRSDGDFSITKIKTEGKVKQFSISISGNGIVLLEDGSVWEFLPDKHQFKKIIFFEKLAANLDPIKNIMENEFEQNDKNCSIM